MKLLNRDLRRFLVAAPSLDVSRCRAHASRRTGIRSAHALSIGIMALILAVPLFGYVSRKSVVTGGQIVIDKWAPSSFPITWRMNPTRSPNVTGTGNLESAFRQAFQAWSAISTATITFAEGQPTAPSVKPGLDQVNLITTNLTPSEWAVYGVDAMSLTNVLSSVTTGQILEADIIFNPNAGFSTEATAPPSLADLQAVATHEIGHLLGLDHTPLASAVMFPLAAGDRLSRTLTADDMIGVSTLYPTAAFATRGSIEGTVRTTANGGVFGAIVVAVGANGQPMAATITGPDGKYSIAGLPAGSYTLLAEPMDGPFTENNFLIPLSSLYPSKTVNINFTTRFR
jgi:matrixin/carboxypeptidase family protein